MAKLSWIINLLLDIFVCGIDVYFYPSYHLYFDSPEDKYPNVMLPEELYSYVED